MELWVSHKYLRGSQSEYLGETIHESDLEKLLVEFCVKNGNCPEIKTAYIVYIK